MSKISPLRIRRAGPPDAAAVRSLTREAYAQWIPVIGREPLPMKADYEKAVREHEIDLLYADDQLVALIEVFLTADHLFIENIAVSPEHQGKGLGHHLLSHAETKAKSAGLGGAAPADQPGLRNQRAALPIGRLPHRPDRAALRRRHDGLDEQADSREAKS